MDFLWRLGNATYYCSKAKNKGLPLRTDILYVCSLILACIAAILVVVGAFGKWWIRAILLYAW